jgi:transposase, IS5 family
MAGLAILKRTYDLSDEVLCERWLENPYYQFFCGEEFFQHRLVIDRSSLTRWRQRMGEEKLQALLQESPSVATKTEAIKPSDLNRVIVDTTVQLENVMFPTDARLLNRARGIAAQSALCPNIAGRAVDIFCVPADPVVLSLGIQCHRTRGIRFPCLVVV